MIALYLSVNLLNLNLVCLALGDTQNSLFLCTDMSYLM